LINKNYVRTQVRRALTSIGRYSSISLIHGLNAATNCLEAGRWVSANGFGRHPRYHDRRQLHVAIGKMIEQEKALYLEFGVYRGDSLHLWSKLLLNPKSSLHGFDSFEGLPEDWNAFGPKGTFDLKGSPPEFKDARITLHQGWFSNTLPKFTLPEHDRLVLHLDSDLYSSTKLVLDTFRRSILPGAILIFDEFSDRMHELRAFDEFLIETQMRFKILGATASLEQVAFERTA
jgi:hypothetical protein